MDEITKAGTYQDFKAAMDQEVRNVTTGFVRMGYLLKVARDTDILRESGYKTVAEFAAAEYGMNETYVSRFMAINDRYSEGGYSERLQDRYQGYGMSLLAEMLTLPAELADAIPQGIKREEIREIKREYDAEQKITPMEVMLEGQPDTADLDMMGMAMREYFSQHREQFAALASVIAREEYSEKSVKEIMDELAPSGIAVLMVRVRGVGRLMISIRGKDQDVEVQNVRSLEKERKTWVELLYILKLIYTGADLSDPEAAWAQTYGEPYREQAEKAEQREEACREQDTRREEDAKREEPADDLAGDGTEPDAEVPEGNGEPEKAAEKEEEKETEKPGIAPAQESGFHEVNTKSKCDSEGLYKQCPECRFHHPESPSRALAYQAVCKDCEGAENFQKWEAPETETPVREQAAEEIPGQDNILNHPEYLPEGAEMTQATVDGRPADAQVEPTMEQLREDALAHLSMIQGNIGIENHRKAWEQATKLVWILEQLMMR